MVNPQGIAIFYDVITLLFAVPSVYMVVSAALAKTMYIPPIIDDDFGIFMGMFFFCVGIPVRTVFTSRFTSQSIEIDSDGIHLDSLLEKGSITWESLESMDFSNEYVAVSRLGIPMPQQLQKRLR